MIDDELRDPDLDDVPLELAALDGKHVTITSRRARACAP